MVSRIGSALLMMGVVAEAAAAVAIVGTDPADNAAIPVSSLTWRMELDAEMAFASGLGLPGQRIRLVDEDGNAWDLHDRAMLGNAASGATVIIPLEPGELVAGQAYHLLVESGALVARDGVSGGVPAMDAHTWNVVVTSGPADALPRPVALAASLPVAAFSRTRIDLLALDGEDPDLLLDDGALAFAVVAAPEHGQLRASGVELAVGGSFTRAELAAGGVDYEHVRPGIAVDRVALAVVNTVDGSRSPSFWLRLAIGSGGLGAPQIAPLTQQRTYAEADVGGTSVSDWPWPQLRPYGASDADLVLTDTGSFSGASAALDIAYADPGRAFAVYDRLFFAAPTGLVLAADGGVDTIGASPQRIGSIIESGSDGTALRVRFTAAADIGQVQTLLRALRYRHESGRLASDSLRRLLVSVDDGADGAQTATWDLLLAAVQSAPRYPVLRESSATVLPCDGAGFIGTWLIEDPEAGPVTVALDPAQSLPARGDVRILSASSDTSTGITSVSWRYRPFLDADGSDAAHLLARDGAGRLRAFRVDLAVTAAGATGKPLPIGDPLLTVQPDPLLTSTFAVPVAAGPLPLAALVQGTLPPGVAVRGVVGSLVLDWPPRSQDGSRTTSAFALIVQEDADGDGTADDATPATTIPFTIVEDCRPLATQ